MLYGIYERHSPLDCTWKMKSKEEQEISEHVKKLVMPIFDKVLQEEKTNTMSVAKSTLNFAWRPNNYRLRIPYKHNITPHSKSSVKLKHSNYGTKHTIKNYNGVTIMVDKKIMTIIYSLGSTRQKKWYNVKVNSIDAMNEYIDKKVKEIEHTCTTAAKKFRGVFGGNLNLEEKKWMRHEDGIHGEEFLDNIPSSLIMNDTYFKKVYPNEMEFKGPAYLKNYISNRAIEQIAPYIALELSKIDTTLQGMNPLKSITDNLSSLQDIFKHKELIKELTPQEKEELELFVFEKFGVSA